MNIIESNELLFIYRAPHGDTAALRGLSLNVARGETVSVLGPSGSGKTTLLNLCAAFERPSSGTLTVLGHSFDRVSNREAARVRRNAIGIVRQHYHRALPRELTSEEIVALPLRLLGRVGRAERKRIAYLLRTTGLADRARARPNELSGGEQQRLALCAALAKQPLLLLADEPTGELDPISSVNVIELLLELGEEGQTTMLLVTHDPEVASRTHRTIHIRDGRLAAEGTASPVLIVDEHGWVRLPRTVREQAGVRERVRATARWGRIELTADEASRTRPPGTAQVPRLGRPEKQAAVEVALDRVTKRYSSTMVLSELSATFAHEQFHVLAGASGSGKTTLLNLIAGLERPDEGEVWVAGERIDSLGPDQASRWRQRVLGYVSQHSTLVDFLSVRENLVLPLAIRGFPRDEAHRRADRWLEWVGLSRAADREAGRLSGGEQRRVALARALAPAPQLLIADEPTAHLERVTGRLVIHLLQELAREAGTTVIAAGHDPDLISAADTTLMLGSQRARPATRPSRPPQPDLEDAAGKNPDV